MMSYSGTVSVDGEALTSTVDLAWDPSWVGTEQLRFYTLSAETLSIRTSLFSHPTFPGQKVVAYLEWIRSGPELQCKPT